VIKRHLYLTPSDHGRPLTLEELERADGLEGYRYELIEGKLEVSPQPNLPHDVLVRWLSKQLDRYISRRPDVLNEVFTPARVLVPGRRATTAPEPDLAAYADFPLDIPLAELNRRTVRPVLVVEVLSEGNAEKDLVRNLGLYLEVPSVREYWILDPLTSPDTPTLTVHRRRGQRWQRPIVVPPGGTYTTHVLPGFSLLIDPHR
jgi:Uma2 family endonuclease